MQLCCDPYFALRGGAFRVAFAAIMNRLPKFFSPTAYG
ncbi:hypothetical protein SAMN05216268_112286 [Streptomyces yunnanensis]|uniref:Uncharacterized protein n=1 Tax=Streptomyces yunnanensis TaxID=156453 RepID=A0A9X8N1M7_9ACTN|nr:hypothetical protein SAMN05216268_112286 [Streptomyces yunnanensis]